jgi:hypothetical protein
MDAFTIVLPEEQAEMAREAGVPAEQLLRISVEEWLDRPDRDFQEAAAYVLDKNRELYRRLA